MTLTLLLLLSALPLSAAAKTVKSGTCGVVDDENDPNGSSLTWTLDENGVLTIRGAGEMGDRLLTDGEAPTAEEVNSIVVEEGVTAISNLRDFDITSLSLPSTLAEIPEDAFAYYYENLKEVHLAEGITAIGKDAFMYCDALEEINLPQSLKTLGESAFRYCRSLKKITLPDGIETIPASAFYACAALETVRLPKELKTIGAYAFEGCEALKKIEFPEGLQTIEADAFKGCELLEQAELPASVKQVGSGVFARCGALRLAVFSAADVQIEDDPFGYPHSKWLQIGCVKGSAAETLASDNHIPFYFLNADNSIPVSVGRAKGTIDRKSGTLTIQCQGAMPDFGWYDDNLWAGNDGLLRRYIRSIVIEDGCTAVGKCEFRDFDVLSSVTLPDSVRSIGSYAFSDCKELETVRLPQSLQTIDDHAFVCCAALKAISLPQTLETIGEEAFYGCAALTQVTIPGSVQNFGAAAFKNTGLRSVVLSEGLTTTGESLFENCENLQSVQVPESMTSFGSKSFSNCPALESLTVPAGMETFETAAIENTSLPTLIFENKDCVIKDVFGFFDYKIPISLNTVICGYEGSTAQKYADENWLEFRSLGNAPAKMGDVDLNGTVNAADARLALRAAVGLENYAENSEQFRVADVDHNYTITAADARLILRAAVGLEVLK